MTVNPSVPLFVTSEGMRDGWVHPSIASHPFLGPSTSAPRYRFSSVGDRFPALWSVPEGISDAGGWRAYRAAAATGAGRPS